MRILFTGGGTGGHIFPIIAVKRAIDSIYSSKDISYHHPVRFEFAGGVIKEKETLSKENIRIKKVIPSKWRRYFSLKNLIDIVKFPFSFLQALLYVWLFMPDIIFAKGGPGSFPIVLTGWLYRIPIIIHESDSIPGSANRLSASFAKLITISFEETRAFFSPSKTLLIGNPIRQKILSGSREKAKERFDLTGNRKIVLIAGGSQGAQQINSVFIDVIYKYIDRYEIIHVCGPKNFKDMELLTKGILRDHQRKFYHLYPHLNEEELGDAYAVAEVIVSRAGAGMIFEIAAVKRPSVLIPLKIAAQKHQAKNAYYFSRKGCATTLEEGNVTPNFVFGRVNQITDSKNLSQKMQQACEKFSKPEAAKEMAEILIKLA